MSFKNYSITIWQALLILLLLAPNTSHSQDNEQLNNELLILYAEGHYKKLQKKSYRLIKKKDTSLVILGYLYSARAHYRMSLDKEFDGFPHLDSSISHLSNYSELAYQNWAESFEEFRDRISLLLYEEISTQRYNLTRDSVEYIGSLYKL